MVGSFIPHVQAADYADMGVLRLQLGQTAYPGHVPVPPRFVYEPKVFASPTDTGFAQPDSQIFLLSGKCGGKLDDRDTASKLATMTSGPYDLGFGPDSIGVYDGPKGVACYRISAGPEEWIRFGLGPDLKEKYKARSFYKLVIDLEVKQNARFSLQVLRAGVATGAPWILESGSSISHPANTAEGTNPYACTARSDSGPDSGANDNCRWVINEVGDGFILKALVGEGSLEGGGDFGSAAWYNNTLIYLTDAEVGAMGCAEPPGNDADGSPYTSVIGDGNERAMCAVARFDTGSIPNVDGCSTNVAYLFRTVSIGIGGCEIAKNAEEQVAAVIDITFPPEPRLELDAKPATRIKFPGPYYLDMPLCKGTLVYDGNGTPSIQEVFDGTLDVDVDGNELNHVQWACILEDEEKYIGDGITDGMEMQVRQRILFFGDPVIIRQDPGNF